MEETCLDTSVLIELARRKLLKYIDPSRDIFYLTEITLYEYLRGIRLLDRDIEKAKEALERLFYVIGFSNEVIKKASDIYSILSKKGVIIPDPDILVASICIIYNLSIASFDKHFESFRELGLRLCDPPRSLTC